MSNNARAHVLLLAASMAPAVYAHADNADAANKSNNPLNLAPGANLQDYYPPKLYDTNAHTNDVLPIDTRPAPTTPAAVHAVRRDQCHAWQIRTLICTVQFAQPVSA